MRLDNYPASIMKTSNRLALVFVCGWAVAGCGGGDKSPPPASLPAAPQGALDPSGGGGMSPEQVAEKQKQEMAAQMNRGVKLGEFQLTLVVDDSAVAQLNAIQVDVISATAQEATRLEGLGPVKYRESRMRGANVRSQQLQRRGRQVVNVPTIPAADTVVLWAEMPPPSAGQDSRMLVVPLALDKSDPAAGPVAHPIGVRLTANGWVRDR